RPVDRARRGREPSRARHARASARRSRRPFRRASARAQVSRAGRFAQEIPPAAESKAAMSDTTSQQLVVFSLGSEEYALPIGAVHEIIRFTEPRTVASEVAWIRGVIGLRGKIIPIFDLCARMQLAAGETEGKIVIVE